MHRLGASRCQSLRGHPGRNRTSRWAPACKQCPGRESAFRSVQRCMVVTFLRVRSERCSRTPTPKAWEWPATLIEFIDFPFEVKLRATQPQQLRADRPSRRLASLASFISICERNRFRRHAPGALWLAPEIVSRPPSNGVASCQTLLIHQAQLYGAME
jgi:hypothetical protein